MSTNYIQNVPKLKGRENYDEWSFAAENLLVLEGKVHYIKNVTGEKRKPTEDRKTRAKLVLTIDPGLYVHIKDTNTSEDLWNKLNRMFEESDFTRKISLLRNLISINLENCDSMTAYVTKLVDTATRLNDTGFAVSDEWVGSLLLAGLPEHFSPMIVEIQQSGIKITADFIKSKLLDMETSNPVADCDRGGAAHAAKNNYRQRHGDRTSSSTLMSIHIDNIITFKCKQNGYFKSQCPLLKKNKQTNAFIAGFLNGDYSKLDWYVDSGASAHMTANREWLKNVNNTPSLLEIVVANESKLPVLCSGDIDIVTEYNYEVTIEKVLCVPNLTTNLLSVSELIKKGNIVLFEENNCYIRNKNNELVAKAALTDGVYKLQIQIKCG